MKIIVFMNFEEMAEAVKCGVLNEYYSHDKYGYNEGKFPVLFWETNISWSFQPNENNAWNKLEYIKILQKSVMWSKLRKDYVKEWYDLPENVGKAVAVRDVGCNSWSCSYFIKYDRGAPTRKFVTMGGRWDYARPLTDDEIIKDYQ